MMHAPPLIVNTGTIIKSIASLYMCMLLSLMPSPAQLQDTPSL